MRRTALAALVLLTLWPRTAQADDSGYGVAVGLGAPLDAESLGLSLGLSAFRADLGGPRAMLRASGELLGIITSETQAVLPTLQAEIGTRLGDAELFVSGGVQMFGFAWRQDYTVFGVVGLCGGLGMSLRVSPRVRLGFRGTVTWLPSDTTGIVVEGTGDKPDFAFVSLMLTLELSPGVAARRPSSYIMPPPEL